MYITIAPSPPVINAVTAIDSTSVRVEWSIPNNTNGVLTFYTITYSIDDGVSTTVDIPYSGQLVSRLCIMESIVYVHTIHVH